MAEPQQGIGSFRLWDRDRLVLIADVLAVALVAALPWSTSAVSIISALWLLAILPTLNLAGLRRVLTTPAGGLPTVLCALALVGMIWAFDATLAERWDSLKTTLRLLFIPLLMLHYSRSDRGHWVLIGFLASCLALLVLSWTVIFVEPVARMLPLRPILGVPVRDYIAQSAEFTICIFVLARMAFESWQARRLGLAAAQLALAAVFGINILYVSASRTSLVTIPVILLLFLLKHVTWRVTVPVLVVASLAAPVVWTQSSILKFHLNTLSSEVLDFRPEGEATRAGARIEFWRKSIDFIAAAPVLGHGTGSIPEQFRRAAVGQTGTASMPSANPHNQTLTIAIQWGLVGAAALIAMWLAHLMAFRGGGLVAWTGLIVVVQNMVGSLFNSHLSDFAHGWGYVIGVGVAAGMLLRRDAAGPEHPGSAPPGPRGS